LGCPEATEAARREPLLSWQRASVMLGTTSVIATVPLPVGGTLILLAVLGFTLLLFPLSISFDWTITRPEGLLLLVLYLAFMGWQLWMGSPLS